MKKSLLTLGAVAAVAASASAQGLLNIGGNVLFNTVTALSSATSGWYTGNITLEVWTIPASGNYSLTQTINSYAANPAADQEAIGLIVGGSLWTQQQVGTPNGAASTEALSQVLSVSGGTLTTVDRGDFAVGTAASLPQTTAIYYALLFFNGISGVVVLNNPPAGYDPSTSPPNSSAIEYPVSGQNILLPSVPEPATLALAGLGGLSMLFLHRRKS
jgi:hypothetical protein